MQKYLSINESINKTFKIKVGIYINEILNVLYKPVSLSVTPIKLDLATG